MRGAAGFWELIPFTLQMSLVIITGHVLATSAPMRAAHPRRRRLAADAARRGGAGDVLRDGELVVQLGLQPDLQRGARARGGAPRRRRRLSRARGRELSRASAASGRRGSADRRRCRWPRPARCSRRFARSSPAAAIVPGGIITFTHTIFLWQSLVSVPGRDRGGDPGDVAGHAAGGTRRGRRATWASTWAPPKFSRRRSWLTRRRAHGSSTRRSCTLLVVALGVTYLVRYFCAVGRAAERHQPRTSSTCRSCCWASCCTGHRRA